MLEILVCSLVVGSLGVQAVMVGSWMCWQQIVEGNQNEEEDILTQYESKENDSTTQAFSNQQQLKDPRLVGWEFKIIRANRNLFRDSSILQQLCEEEAEAGWILLEKLDDNRLRFKRPMALRYIQPTQLVNDPYRSHYGSSWQPLNWLSAIAALVATLLPAYLSYALVSQSLASSKSVQSQPPVFPPLEQPPTP